MTNLNLKRPGFREKLAASRQHSCDMLRNLIPVLLEVLRHGGDIYFEWPHRCHGWYIPELEELANSCLSIDRKIYFARIDGCQYGLKSLCGEGFLLKQRRVLTTDRMFDAAVGRICYLQHLHVTIVGKDTERSGYSPEAMAQAIASHWVS